MTNLTIPSPNHKVLTEAGTFSLAWWRYLTSLSPYNVLPDSVITVTASPFAYTATDDGSVVISSGTISDVSVKRTTTSYSIGTTRQVEVGKGDIVTVTYSVAPTMALFPR